MKVAGFDIGGANTDLAVVDFENNEVKNDDSIMAELFDSSEVKNEGFSLN